MVSPSVEGSAGVSILGCKAALENKNKNEDFWFPLSFGLLRACTNLSFSSKSLEYFVVVPANESSPRWIERSLKGADALPAPQRIKRWSVCVPAVPFIFVVVRMMIRGDVC